MRTKKTRLDQRTNYSYPVNTPDGRGGYRTTYNQITPEDVGETTVWISALHRMDDNEVSNNIKNWRPKLTLEKRAEKENWELEHPGEKYPMEWSYSLDHEISKCEDGDISKSSILASASYDPFEEMEVSDEVMKLRDIVRTRMTDRQRQVYQLVVLEGYTKTEAAKIMGISIKVAKVHFDKAIECIIKNFEK